MPEELFSFHSINGFPGGSSQDGVNGGIPGELFLHIAIGGLMRKSGRCVRDIDFNSKFHLERQEVIRVGRGFEDRVCDPLSGGIDNKTSTTTNVGGD